MEWLNSEAYPWFVRHAAFIAGIEFAILVISWPGKMIVTYLMNRRNRKTANRIEELYQKTESSEANADRRHQELVDLRSVLAKVDMEPLGDSARVGRLPERTNIVEMPNGQIRLALPVRLEAAGSIGAAANLSAAVLKTSPPEQGKESSK